MTTVTRARGATGAAVGRTTDLIKVKVQENDPTLKATATAFGVKVTGTASNNGKIASFIELSFDGHKVKLPVARGDTGTQLLKKLSKALPQGFQARLLEDAHKTPPEVTIGIARKQTAPAKFPGTVKGAGWSPGSGIVTPGGGGARMGLYVNVLTNPLTMVTSSVKLDAAKKTIFVTVNGKTGNPNHAADIAKNLPIASPAGMKMGTAYKLVVQDAAGHKLFGTNVTPFPAA